MLIHKHAVKHSIASLKWFCFCYKWTAYKKATIYLDGSGPHDLCGLFSRIFIIAAVVVCGFVCSVVFVVVIERHSQRLNLWYVCLWISFEYVRESVCVCFWVFGPRAPVLLKTNHTCIWTTVIWSTVFRHLAQRCSDLLLKIRLPAVFRVN